MAGIVGIARENGRLQAARLADGGSSLVVIAELERFWQAPQRWIDEVPRGESLARSEVTIVPPVLPGAQILCAGLNYRDHAEEGSYGAEPPPEHPTIFGRWPRSLSVDGAEIPVPADEEGLDWEGEVVAWVGRTLSGADAEEALAAVVGYSVFNDLTARRAQKRTSQWTLGKNADASGPLGPLVPAAEVGDLGTGLRLQTIVNGEKMQDASTADMLHPVGPTLAAISRTLTLRPGDLLATGTPAGVGYARKPPRLLQPGDAVEVRAERLGSVRNTIVDGLR